jgi:hypothetical protein
MSGVHDPFAAIAEPVQNQTADPFAAIADKPGDPEARTFTPTPGNAFKSGDFIGTLRANLDEGTRDLTSEEKKNTGTVAKALRGFGVGAENTLIRPVLHPVDTAKGLVHAGAHLLDPFGPDSQNPVQSELKGTVQDYEKNGPAFATGNLFGKFGAGLIEGEAGGAALRTGGNIAKDVAGVIPKAGRSLMETVTETTPRETANIVKGASEENAAELAKANEKNASNAAQRKVDLKKHFDKTQAINAEKGAAETAASTKAAAARGVEKADEPLREDLTKLKDTQHKIANDKFEAVNSKLNNLPIDHENLTNAWAEQAHAFGEVVGPGASGNLPPILTKIGKAIEKGDPLTYKDEQLLYSELGRELSKGTLPGPTYHAYDMMHEAIGNDMQRVADSQGLGPQLKDARASWGNLKKTFYDPKSPVTKALKATERGGTVKAFRGADRTGIEAVAKYDPALARRLASTRDVQATAAAPVKAAPTRSLPKLPAKPAEVVPKTTTVTPESAAGTKVANYLKATDDMRHSKSPLVSAVAGYGSIKALLARNLGTAGLDITARILYGAAKPALADLLENPRVMNELTKFTPRDAAAIAKLPADQRAAFVGDLTPVVKAAQAKGTPVSPALLGVLGTVQQPRKGVAAALRP